MARSTGPQQPVNPGVGLFVVAFFLSPFILLLWAAGQALLRRTGWRGWRLGLPALAGGALVVWFEGGPVAALALHFSGCPGSACRRALDPAEHHPQQLVRIRPHQLVASDPPRMLRGRVALEVPRQDDPQPAALNRAAPLQPRLARVMVGEDLAQVAAADSPTADAHQHREQALDLPERPGQVPQNEQRGPTPHIPARTVVRLNVAASDDRRYGGRLVRQTSQSRTTEH
jgi:hypothetical protein